MSAHCEKHGCNLVYTKMRMELDERGSFTGTFGLMAEDRADEAERDALKAALAAADAEAKRPRERCCDNCRWWRPIPCRDYGKCDAPLSLTYPAADEGCTRWEARS